MSYLTPDAPDVGHAGAAPRPGAETGLQSGAESVRQADGSPSAVVAVVASAGGVEALTELVSLLPADFPAAVLVLLHVSPDGSSVLPRILGRAGKLPARHPKDGDRLAAGVVTVAPPDRHLVVSDGQVRVLTGARENGHRPSADVLLRSVAQDFGDRGAGVVMSGLMDDGAVGLRAVRIANGLALVQDPHEAAFPGMPTAAIEEAHPQFVGTVAALAKRLCEWVAQLPADPPEIGAWQPVPGLGEPTALTCPECGGTLFEQDVFGAERLRCRVGHTFSLDGLAVGKREVLEKSLWAAVVALNEQADLFRRMEERFSASGQTARAARYREDITGIQERAAVLLSLIQELVKQAGTRTEQEANGDS